MTNQKFRIDPAIELTEENLKSILAQYFPAGDPLFQEITWEEQALYNRKNQDYAGGGEDPNGNFHRAATIFSLYPGLSLADPRTYAMVQLMKQFDQVLWSLSRGFEGTVEGLEARLGDISVYAKIIMVLNRRMDDPKLDLENLTAVILDIKDTADERG